MHRVLVACLGMAAISAQGVAQVRIRNSGSLALGTATAAIEARSDGGVYLTVYGRGAAQVVRGGIDAVYSRRFAVEIDSLLAEKPDVIAGESLEMPIIDMTATVPKAAFIIQRTVGAKPSLSFMASDASGSTKIPSQPSPAQLRAFAAALHKAAVNAQAMKDR